MQVNTNHVSMREGSGYLNGVKVMENCVLQIIVTPEVWEGRKLKQQSKDRRWIGIDYKVSLTEYKSTPWLKEAVKKYQGTGETPEFRFQGIQDDENSDYFKTYGMEAVTCSGCVITSDINLIDLDTDGEMVKSSIEMGAKELS